LNEEYILGGERRLQRGFASNLNKNCIRTYVLGRREAAERIYVNGEEGGSREDLHQL
jgi:hypothetical protein